MGQILILKAQDICYGLLDSFADNMAAELNSIGLEVDEFDIKKETPAEIAKYAGQTYLAVIDFYSGLLPVKFMDGNYFWDSVNAPIYQLCFDLPMYIDNLLGHKLKRYHALCMNKFYIDVFSKYYGINDRAYFFQVAGKEGDKKIKWEQRSNEVAFVGTFFDYREALDMLENYNDDLKVLGKTLFDTMTSSPSLTPLDAFDVTLQKLNINICDEEKIKVFSSIGKIARAANAYVREQIIETLISNDITVNVYGTSWNTYASKYNTKYASNLIIHNDIDERGYVEATSSAKITLGIMYPNKEGFSERCSYAMLNGSLLLVEDCKYIKESFVNGEELVTYSLDNVDGLPGIIKGILSNPEKSSLIAMNGYEKAKLNYTWQKKTADFLEIVLAEYE